MILWILCSRESLSLGFLPVLIRRNRCHLSTSQEGLLGDVVCKAVAGTPTLESDMLGVTPSNSSQLCDLESSVHLSQPPLALSGALSTTHLRRSMCLSSSRCSTDVRCSSEEWFVFCFISCVGNLQKLRALLCSPDDGGEKKTPKNLDIERQALLKSGVSQPFSQHKTHRK